MLDIQVKCLSVDTGDFYSNKEALLHYQNHKLRMERNALKKNADEIINELKKYEIDKDMLKGMTKEEYDFNQYGNDSNIVFELCKKYFRINDLIKSKNEKIKESKNKLLKLLSNKIESNISSNGKHHIRELRNLNPSGNKKDIFKYANEQFNDKKIISVFDSAFTRMIGVKQDEFTEDFMVIQVYYFDVIKDLIYYGFTYKGEKYRYFTSSAGQIRTKKTVFVKESVWNKYEKTIMCGLTIDSINEKGGNNPNKHLAYMALTNSATDVWEEFDIDKTIVIDDFETDVYSTYDLINDKDYSIKRMSGYIPIPHTDGAGMILPNAFNEEQKNKMVRLPWIKGLLGVFDFKKFIEINSCSSKIKDIYGKEWDVVEDDIQLIFTKSQFKMYKYYDSWEQYKQYYKQYGCSVGYTNPEEERIKDASINYQMLQTLTDITEEEIDTIIKLSNDKISNLCSSIGSMKNAFGVSPYNTNMTYFQKAINLYPDLMNDEYAKASLREIKNSMVKKFKSGNLAVKGKYTFLLPDFYAACEYWFLNNKNPSGLLENGEVFCWLFRKNEKLDCLRSPHLFLEHAIRKNIAWNGNKEKKQKLREWFTTDAIYTSCKDAISKILQFDVDGDKALVIADETIIKVAERNIKKLDIVPLYYNMAKAKPTELNNENIYHGLNAAFTGGNIGIYSNNISKIWNSDVFISGTLEEKHHAINCIKRLCCQNNFVIDYAKTLYKPEFPKHINQEIKEFTNKKLPHFFVYAKDKKDEQVEVINNSFVNQLDLKIKNPRINSRGIGLNKIDYRILVNNPDIQCNVVFEKNGRLNEKLSDPMIVKYCELNREYHFKINMECADNISKDLLSKSAVRQELFYRSIANEVKTELSKFGYTDSEIVDILVKFLYYVKPSQHKSVLWFCYGKYIFENIERYLKSKTKEIQCIDCGEWFEVDIKASKSCRCRDCQKKADYTPIKIKNIICIDCGKKIIVDSSSRVIRCENCHTRYQRERNRIKNEAYRKRDINS